MPTQRYPLNGIFEFDQARALKKFGHEVTYVGLDFRSIFKLRRFGFFKVQKEGINCFLFSIPIGNIELPFFNIVAKIFTNFGIIIFKKYFVNSDIIHSHFFQISSLAIGFKKCLKIPLIVTEHSSLLNTSKINDTIFSLAKHVYSNSDFIISVSTSLQRMLKSNLNVDSVVINNIIDISFQNKVGNFKHLYAEGNFIFLSVGTLNYNKGFDILIDAFHKSNFPKNVKLQIIGDGELKDELNILIKSRRIENQVFLVGYKSRDEISEYLSTSNAFVLASRSETFGLVYAEALAAGLPVIATKCGGPEEFIDDTNGVLVPLNDSWQLSKALIEMKDGYMRYNCEYISNLAINKFSSYSIANKITNIYLQLAST